MTEQEMLARIAELEAENDRLKGIKERKVQSVFPKRLTEKFGGTRGRPASFLEGRDADTLSTLIRQTCFKCDADMRVIRPGHKALCEIKKRINEMTPDEYELYTKIMDEILEVLARYAIPIEERRKWWEELRFQKLQK